MIVATNNKLRNALELINIQREAISSKLCEFDEAREYMYNKLNTMREKFDAIQDSEDYQELSRSQVSDMIETICRHKELINFIGNGTHAMQKQIEELFVLTESLEKRTDYSKNRDLMKLIEDELNCMSIKLEKHEFVFMSISRDMIKEIM